MHNYVSTCAGIRYILGNHCVCLVASVMSNSMPPYGLSPTRLLCPWDSPDENTGVACHALLQGSSLTQGSKPMSLVSPALAGRLFTTSTTWEALEITLSTF